MTIFGCVVAIYFALWLVPRIAPIKANVMMAEDYCNVPAVHLGTYRPLLFADLALWNAVIGKEYLQTVFPKLLAGVYISLAGLFTVLMLRRWGSPMLVALLIPVFYVTHPIVNELSLWNLITGLNLSLLLIVIGYFLLGDVSSKKQAFAGFFFMATGVSGYQIHAGLLPVLFIGEFIIKRVNGIPFGLKESAQKVIIIVAVMATYFAYFAIARSILGYHDYGSRGLPSLSSSTLTVFLSDKWHGITNMYANLFQSMISYYFGIESSWRYWKWISPALGAATFFAALSAGRSKTDALLFSFTPVLLPVFATLVLLASDVTPSGWRVCAPTLYAFCLSLTPLMTLMIRGRSQRIIEPGRESYAINKVVPVVVTLLWLAFSFPVIAYDGDLRVQAKEQDERLLREIADYWRTKGIPRAGYSVTVYPQDRNGARGIPVEQKGRGIVVNFNKLGPNDYTNLPRQFWSQVLEHYGFCPLYISPDNKELRKCMDAACGKEEEKARQAMAELEIVHLEKQKLSVICR